MTAHAGSTVTIAGKVGHVLYIDQDFGRVVWSDGSRTWEDLRLLTVLG